MNYKLESAIRKKARTITKDLTLQDIPINPIDLIYIKYNIKIETIYDDLCGEDGYIFYKKGKYRIYLDINKHPKRRTFTEAHEIGHIALGHFKLSEYERNKYNKFLDMQADLFASELLMPYNLILQLKEKMPILTDASIARRFGVSNIAMEIRIKNLNKMSFK